MPGRKKATKFDRCLKAVKRKGVRFPGAVCQTSVGRGNPATVTPAIARAAGADAANRQMKKAGRTKWSRADYNLAARTYAKLMKLTNPAHRKRTKPIRRTSKKSLTVRKRNPARRNPEAQAVETYRDFHGKSPSVDTIIETPVKFHRNLAGIGKLE